jgi:hypothetical protein
LYSPLYRSQHAVEIGIDVVVEESQYPESVLLQKTGPGLVIDDALVRTVLPAIQFDNQMGFKADEVHNVRPDGLLAPEFAIMKLAAA